MKRRLYVIGGILSVIAGAVGIVVPGMPTTCFLLLASWLFARSSPNLYRRLRSHRLFGRYLALAEGGAMPLRARLVSLAAMWGGIAASLFATRGLPTVVPMAIVVLGLVGTVFLVTFGRREVTLGAGGVVENLG